MFAPTSERAPSLPALLVWRHLRGPQDYRTLADIGRRANLADHVDDVVTLEWITGLMEHPANFDPRQDVLIGEIEGRAVAWQYTYWRQDSEKYLYELRGFVSPGWRRRGIGRALLRLGEQRLRQVAAQHPSGAGRALRTFSMANRLGKVALFESEGYRVIRHFYTMLRRDLDHLPAAPLPGGVELRPALPEHFRLIWDSKEEAFLDHWQPTVLTEEDYQRWQRSEDFDPSLWQIAWDTASNQVAGVSLNSVPSAENRAYQRQRGVVEELAVRRPWRQRGLGRALLVNSLRALRERGADGVALGVDAENLSGALRLYQAVGFQPIEHGLVLSKPMEVALWLS
jgi:mycothiol synthase